MSTARGRSRRSESLGGSDPRHRRDAASAASEQSTFELPLLVDETTSRVGLQPCPNVAAYDGALNMGALRNKINELLDALKAGGIMEE